MVALIFIYLLDYFYILICVFFFKFEMIYLQKLLLIRCLRPDRLTTAIHTYIASTIGKEFLVAPIIQLNQIFTASSPKFPILIYPSNEMDPTPDIFKAADKYNGAKVISVNHHSYNVCSYNFHTLSQIIRINSIIFL